MRKVDVAIVGGGVAGGAAACAFGAAGLEVALFERRDLARDPNRGDALEVDTVAALDKVGARAELERRGARRLSEMTVSEQAGRASVRFDMSRNARLVLNHAEIEHGLLTVAGRRGVVVYPETVEGVQLEAGGWRIITEGRQLLARLLIGADGARSLVRTSAGIPVQKLEYDHAMMILHADQPGWLGPEEGALMLHPAGSILVLPTTPHARCRLVVPVVRDEVSGWLAGGDAGLRDRLAGRDSRLGDLRIERRGGSHVYHVTRQHASSYVATGLALIGDAAHVTHPMGGWGMNLAIRDAVALAELAVPCLKGTSPHALSSALAQYERRRRPENSRTLSAAHHQRRLLLPGRLEYFAARSLLRLLSCFRGIRTLPLLR